MLFTAAPSCPDTMVYKECGYECAQKCGNEGYEAECGAGDCVDGCFCPDGKLTYYQKLCMINYNITCRPLKKNIVYTRPNFTVYR